MGRPDSKSYYTRERVVFIALTAVIGIGLVLPFGIGDLDRPEAQEAVGRIAGQPVSRADFAAVEGHVDILAALDAFSRSAYLSGFRTQSHWLLFLALHKRHQSGPDWVRFWESIGVRGLGDLSQREVREGHAWTWLAYLRAADRAGVRVTPDEVRQFIRSIAASQDASTLLRRFAEAERGNAGVTPDVIRQVIRSLLWRRPAGEFDRDEYFRIVQSDAGLSMSVERFEWAVEAYLRVEKYFSAVGDAAVVTAQEILDTYLDQNREVEVAHLGFPPEDFAAAVKPPSRDAVARYFEANRSRFEIPAKVQIEYLLAEREKLLEGIEAPTEADVKAHYDRNKERSYSRPGAGPEAPPVPRPLEEVREQVVKDLRLQRAGRKAFELLQKALLEIGALEAKLRRDPAAKLDLQALAATLGVAHGTTHFFAEGDVEQASRAFGKFSESRDQEAFQRRVFEEMKDGEVMPGQNTPVATEKGWLVYRLLRRKPARTPSQLTAEVEEEIGRELRRNALDALARAEAERAVGRVNERGLERAEAELQRTLHRTSPLKPGRSFPDPAGGHGNHPDGARIVQEAFNLRRDNQVGKARLLDAGPARPKYAVVLLRALEATLDDFEKNKASIKEQLLENNWDFGTASMTPGKRQLLIEQERVRLQQGIERKPAEPARPSPAGGR